MLRLEAETGELEEMQESLEKFFERAEEDIAGYLSLSLDQQAEPGQLLIAYPLSVLRWKTAIA